MDSQTTLVPPTEPDPAHAKLYFTPDNMRNARVTLAGKQVYTITSSKDFSSTDVLDGAGARVLRIEYNTVFPDTITWRDAAPGKLKEWLPKQKEYPVHFVAANGTRCLVKADPHRRLAVYVETEPSQPLAWYVKETAEHSAYLAVTQAGEAVRDEALAAMLVLRPQLAAGYATYKKAGGMARDMGRPFSTQVYT